MGLWTDKEWQHAADVAQFYLTAGANGFESMLQSTIDTGRCEQVLADARERGIAPRPRDELLARVMKSAGWPTFPGEDEPPVF